MKENNLIQKLIIKQNWDSLFKTVLKAKVFESDLTQRELAQFFGLHENTLRRRIKEFKIPFKRRRYTPQKATKVTILKVKKTKTFVAILGSKLLREIGITSSNESIVVEIDRGTLVISRLESLSSSIESNQKLMDKILSKDT